MAVIASVCLLVGGLAATVVFQQLEINDLRRGQSDSSSQCDEARRLMEEGIANQGGLTPGEQMQKKEAGLRKAANVIQQNPECFSVDERATSKTWLDQLGTG